MNKIYNMDFVILMFWETCSFSLDGLLLGLFIFSANSRRFCRISSSSGTSVLMISTGLTTSGTLTGK